MSQLNERGANSERNSALWGTGGRGGDRSSVLWGKGGRGIVVGVMVVALAAPLAATASRAKQPSMPARHASAQLAPAKKAKLAPAKKASKAKHAPAKTVKKATVKKVAPAKKITIKKTATAPAAPTTATTTPVTQAPVAAPAAAPAVPQGGNANSADGTTYVAPVLLNKATDTPDTRPGDHQLLGRHRRGEGSVTWLSKLAAQSNEASDLQNINLQNLDLIGGVSLSVPAKWLDELRKVPGLHRHAGRDGQSLRHRSASSRASSGRTSRATRTCGPATRRLRRQDAGDRDRRLGHPGTAADFGSRVVASVNLSTLAGNTLDPNGRQRGHGTFVAGIAAGAAPDLAGAAPARPLVSIKVMNDQGMAKTSDVITACQWILDNKAQVQHPRRELLAALELQHELLS